MPLIRPERTLTGSSAYTVSLKAAAPRLLAAVHVRVPVSEVPRSFGRHLDKVYAAARAGEVVLDGQNVFIYRDVPGRAGEADVAFGVGALASFIAVGEVRPTVVPGGEVATTTHHGNYAQLGAAHAAIIHWCDRNGRRLAGTRWEVYGHWSENEAELRTDIFYLLHPYAA